MAHEAGGTIQTTKQARPSEDGTLKQCFQPTLPYSSRHLCFVKPLVLLKTCGWKDVGLILLHSSVPTEIIFLRSFTEWRGGGLHYLE